MTVHIWLKASADVTTARRLILRSVYNFHYFLDVSRVMAVELKECRDGVFSTRLFMLADIEQMSVYSAWTSTPERLRKPRAGV